MPYRLNKNGNCVIKKDTGETVKCHASREEAVAHLRALYANVKKSAIDKTIMVSKGAPIGNRNAAKDYTPERNYVAVSRMRAIVNYREQGDQAETAIKTAWHDAMDAAMTHDYTKLANAKAVIEAQYKKLGKLRNESGAHLQALLSPDVSVEEGVMAEANKHHNQLYGMYQDASEKRKLVSTMMRKFKFPEKKSVV